MLTKICHQLILAIDGWGISSETAHRWTSPDLTDDKSTLVQEISQVIIWANVDQDLCPHMTSIGYIELNHNERTGEYHLTGVTVAYLTNINDIQRT